MNKHQGLRLSNAESHQFTKECIRTSLIYLMNELPFEKITVTAIINRSGVSRAAFYRNYASKEEVLREIGDDIYHLVASSLTNEKFKTDPLQWYIDSFTEVKKNAAIFQLFIQAKMPPDFIFPIEEPPRQELSPLEHYRAIAAIHAVKQILISWFQDGMKESPEEMGRICHEIFGHKKEQL